MPRFSEDLMVGFCQEMRKEALSPGQVLGYATGTGAALGGLWQGGKGYQEAREQGASRTDALRSAATRGAKGAVGGAAVGGALGGVHYARGGKGFVLPEKVPLVGGKTVDPGKSLAEFGGHMGHVWTGRGSASQWGAGAAGAQKATQEAAKATKKIRATPAGEVKDPRWFASYRAKMTPQQIKAKAVEQAQKAEELAQKRHAVMGRVEEAGLTSIPGTVKGLAKDPRRTAAAFKEYLGSMGNTEKAFVYGFPAAFGALGAAAPAEDQSRLGGALSGVASSAPWMMPWMPKSIAMPFLPGAVSAMPQMALGKPLEAVGGAVGNAATSGYRRAAGMVQPPPEGQE